MKRVADAAGAIYVFGSVFQGLNIGIQFAFNDSSSTNRALTSFPDSAIPFVALSSMVIGGALWPISLPIMIYQDMKHTEKRN